MVSLYMDYRLQGLLIFKWSKNMLKFIKFIKLLTGSSIRSVVQKSVLFLTNLNWKNLGISRPPESKATKSMNLTADWRWLKIKNKKTRPIILNGNHFLVTSSPFHLFVLPLHWVMINHIISDPLLMAEPFPLILIQKQVKYHGLTLWEKNWDWDEKIPKSGLKFELQTCLKW